MVSAASSALSPTKRLAYNPARTARHAVAALALLAAVAALFATAAYATQRRTVERGAVAVCDQISHEEYLGCRAWARDRLELGARGSSSRRPARLGRAGTSASLGRTPIIKEAALG